MQHKKQTDLVSEALAYIEDYWQELERFNPHDDGTLIGLPHPYFIPSNSNGSGFEFNEMYYWDSYFMAQGLFNTEREQMVRGLVENMVAMLHRFHIIPNASRFYHTSRSQPPFLTTLIFEVYERTHDKQWLLVMMQAAKEEYRQVWMGAAHPNWRQVFEGLSRHYQVDATHDLAETESGWDMNPRFGRKCLSYIPIDLNALLYKYETDFAAAASINGDTVEAMQWHNRAEKRKETIDRYLWDDDAQFYFDYNFETGKQSKVWSLAPYYAMWAGMLSEERAHILVKHLKEFEFPGGLVCTTVEVGRPETIPLQWSYPNGWAPLHWLVCQGLRRYGYQYEAERIAKKWVKANLIQFAKHGLFFEKYNVVNPNKMAKDGLYPMQTGFGWTNAIFYRFCTDFLSADAMLDLFPSARDSQLMLPEEDR